MRFTHDGQASFAVSLAASIQVAAPRVCHWTTSLRDHTGLAIAVFENTEPAYLIHPEHGGSGIAPGRWLVRRQQERGTAHRRNVLIAD